MERSKLVIEEKEPTVRCPSCGYEGPAKYLDDPAFHFGIPTLTCPKCEKQVTIVSGRECTIKDIGIIADGESDQSKDASKGE